MNKVIKWTNKYSNEQGYVMTVKKADGHFTNTYEVSEAKVFTRQADITKAMNLLETMGETENNVFEAVEI
ncbi:MAG: hypothetical protein HUJ69_05170 [Lachnospiraceae bacterium]|nr:hypothetical protein [Lachnospiraceae bacterium]